MTGPALALEKLSAPFGSAPGLREVSFNVAAGERVVLVGGSGAGKTTLLRAIAGLGRITGGRITIGGRDVTTDPPERRDAVYLHQTPLLFPHMSVAANVAFPLQVRRVPNAEINGRVQDALETVQLGDFRRRAPRTLSGGQRHRVALARAVVARPAVLLLDEPLSALDPALREEVRDSLLALQRQYRPAIVLVTHDLEEAGILADRLGILLDGRIAQLAPPAELFSAPRTVRIARFLGIPNLVPGVVEPDGAFRSAFGRFPAAAPACEAPQASVAVFRSDGARLRRGGILTGRVVGIRQGPRHSTVQLEAGGVVVEVVPEPGALPEPGAAVAWELDPTRCTFLDP